jgi:hypothetical protein|tara:strand:+ start:867 stop:1217 length:351 start_codon:yes stop_codon:yes gene_type:complete
MDDIVRLITELGFPVAAALGLGIFVWKLINRIIDGMESKIDVVDDKVNEQLKAMEDRLQSKLDAQHGILVALIDRVRSVDNEIIRQDTLLKTMLGVPNLVQREKIAKAERDDQRKD